MIEQINLIINNIAEKLGIAVEKLYPILLMQCYIDGVKSAIWFIIALIGFIVMFPIFKKSAINPEVEHLSYSTQWTGMQFFKFWGSVIILVISAITIIVSLNTMLTAFINPNWYIIKGILNQLGR